MGIKARQSFKLTEPQTLFLNIGAGTLGVTVAELIRRIIDQYRLTRRPREFQETHNENLSRYPRRGNDRPV
jgi:hypothetical protein